MGKIIRKELGLEKKNNKLRMVNTSNYKKLYISSYF